jgi:hypothetical protein
VTSSFLLALVFVFSINTNAEIIDCFYDGDDFYVTYNGQSERTFADDHFAGAVFDCSFTLAALYDGDDLHIFNDDTGRFEQKFVDDDFLSAQLAVSRNLIGFYDGDDFFIYNRKTRGFSRNFADDNYSDAKLVSFRGGMAFYDGDDLFVYDLASENFDQTFVDDHSSYAALAGTRHGVLFYDGDDIHSYCGGSFDREFADDNQEAHVLGRHQRFARGLSVGDNSYTLSADCRIIKNGH